MILQMSLKQHTLLTSVKDFSPRPPSRFGLQTSDQATFAFLLFKSDPDHRKAELIFSISLMQALGSLKAEIYKLVRLAITELKIWSLPA